MLQQLLIIALALALPFVKGQGLKMDSYAQLGARNRVQSLMEAYAVAQSSAQQLQASFAAMTPTSCSGNKAALCGKMAATGSSAEEEGLSLMTAPAAYDSRLPQHTGGLNLVKLPGNQGSTCNACVAFALASAAETAIAARLRRNVSSIPRLSPRALFFCPESGATKASCSGGWNLAEALRELSVRLYLTPERCLPWTYAAATTDASKLCSPVCTANQLRGLVQDLHGKFEWTDAQPLDSIPAIQKHIRQWGAVITRFDLDLEQLKAWAKASPQGIYRSPRRSNMTSRPQSSTSPVGHAVVLVGYNNTPPGYWIVKQSYGPKFADGGFHKVRYGSSGVADPSFTYGLTWEPTRQPAADASTAAVTATAAAAAAPAERLKVIAHLLKPAEEEGCVMYPAQAGDYAQRVATLFGIPVQRLLTDNVGVIPHNDPGTWLAGRVLRICGAAVPQGAQVPSMCTLVHTTRARETCSHISLLRLTTPTALQQLNPKLPCAVPNTTLPEGTRVCLSRRPVLDSGETLQCIKSLRTQRAARCSTFAKQHGLTDIELLEMNPYALSTFLTCGNNTIPQRVRLCIAVSYAPTDDAGVGRNPMESVEDGSSAGPANVDANEVADMAPDSLQAELNAVKICTACAWWWQPSAAAPPPTSACQLNGIVCGDTGHVNAVRMGFKVLQGTLPASFGSLKRVQVVEFHGNRLEGRLPTSWANLTQLQYLDLHSNLLSGTLPASYARLKQAQYIDVSSNKLTGTLPTLWAALHKLELLDLHSNQLEGTVPASWGALPALKYISLSGNTKLHGCLPSSWTGRVLLYDASVEAFVPSLTTGARQDTLLAGFCSPSGVALTRGAGTAYQLQQRQRAT